MATDNVIRQNIPNDPLNPVGHLNSGYEDEPSEFSIPPCLIEDVDFALHRLFDKTIGFNVHTINGIKGAHQINKPFVIFATGERFALVKRLRPPRDRNKALILPAISIRRTTIEQTSEDLTGRGINQFTGNLTIKRKLDSSDRDYQNLINKLGFKHIQTVLTGLPETTRTTGEFRNEVETIEGGLLEPHLSNNNIYEIISIPQPQFFTATYEVTFWTNYVQHMLYLIQTYMSSFLPQIRGHKLETDKGYWFIAYTEDIFQSGENFDEFAGEERIVRYTFNIKVKGYLLAPQYPTNKVPIRRWFSCPNIVFDMISVPNEIVPKNILERPPIKDSTKPDPFTLTDFNEDPDISQTSTSLGKYAVKKVIIDPITKKRRIKYVRILERNFQKGETSFAASDVETLEQFILSQK